MLRECLCASRGLEGCRAKCRLSDCYERYFLQNAREKTEIGFSAVHHSFLRPELWVRAEFEFLRMYKCLRNQSHWTDHLFQVCLSRTPFRCHRSMMIKLPYLMQGRAFCSTKPQVLEADGAGRFRLGPSRKLEIWNSFVGGLLRRGSPVSLWMEFPGKERGDRKGKRRGEYFGSEGFENGGK